MSRSVWGREETRSVVPAEERPVPGAQLPREPGARAAAPGLAHAVPNTATPAREPLPPLFLGRRVSGSRGTAGTRPCLSACPPQRFLNSQKTLRCPEGVMATKQDSPSELCFTLASSQHLTSPAAGVGEAGGRAPSRVSPTSPPCPSPAPVTHCPFGSPRRGDSRSRSCAGRRCAQWPLPRFPLPSQQPTRGSRTHLGLAVLLNPAEDACRELLKTCY